MPGTKITAPIPMPTRDFLTEVALGLHDGYSLVHKFGFNSAVGTSLEPITSAGVYQTPTSTVTLAAISSDADDTAAGAGAQQITVQYLDSTFTEQTDTIEMNGTTETTDTITGVLRVYRVWVSRSGTYATSSTPSQQGTITIRVENAGSTWATIPLADTGFGAGQSQIAWYTVPSGYTAYILSFFISVDTNQSADIFFFKRENADDTSSPYSGVMRAQNSYIGVNGVLTIDHKTNESYPAMTDIGFLGKAAANAEISCEFELLLKAN